MAAIALQSPLAQFFDTQGRPLSDGELYFGAENLNPITDPVTVYWDAAMTIPAPQPIRTQAGYTYRSGTPAAVYLPGNVSMLARDKSGQQVGYFPTSADFSNVAALIARLANEASTNDGPGMIDIGPTLNYVAGTLGFWVTKAVTDFNVFKWIPPAQWGAILDGTSTYDAGPAWATAITNALASGRPATVSGPTGYYYFATVIGEFTGNYVTVDGNGSTFNAAGLSTGSLAYFLRFTGTYGGTPSTLTSNAASFQKTVACNSSAFAPGDMVRLYSSTLFDPARTSTRYGELNWIETVPDGISVTLANDTAATYTTADSAKLEKVIPCRDITIKNFRLLGPAANDLLFGMRLTLCVNSVIENVRSYDWDTCHAQLVDCHGCKVQRCHFEESNSSGTGYGVSIADASQGNIVTANSFKNVRHATSTNNDTAGSYGVTRKNIFSFNVVEDSAKTLGGTGGDAMDAHAGSEDNAWIGNIINSASGSGINCEGRSCKMLGNEIYNVQGNGWTWQNYSALEGEADISGNTVRNWAGSYAGAVVSQGAGIKSLTLNGNNHKGANRCLQIIGVSGKEISNLVAAGNSFVSTGSNTAANFEYVIGGSFSGGAVEALAIPILVDSSSRMIVNAVSIKLTTSGSGGHGVRFTGTGEGNIVSGCTLHNSGGATTTAAVTLPSTSTNSRIFGCTAKGFTAGVIFNVNGGAGSTTDSTNVSY